MSNRNEIREYSLTDTLCNYIGETVTIYTTSGGVSGCGFTGVILSVNCHFIRLLTRFGVAPTSPFGTNSFNRTNRCGGVGSVCDIPLDRIASFCHNAV